MKRIKILVISFVIILLCNYLMPLVYATENLISNESSVNNKIINNELTLEIEKNNEINNETKKELVESNSTKDESAIETKSNNEIENKQEIEFASQEIKQYLLENYDIDNDKKITQYDMEQIVELYIPYLNEKLDLQGLEYATSLKYLSVCNAENLQVLSSLNELESLDVADIYSLEDYEALKLIPNLKNLNLSSIDFEKYDLAELPNQLEKLVLNWCYIDDITNIKYLNLKELEIDGRQYSEKEIIGLESINEISNLAKLEINNLDITNIEFLRDNSSIEDLDIASNQITDISTIATMKNLKHILIHENNIQDMSVLENSPLIQDESFYQYIVLDNYEVIQGEILEIELPKTIRSMFDETSSFYSKEAKIEKTSEELEGKGAYINEDNTKIIIDATNLNLGEKTETFGTQGTSSVSFSTITVNYTVRAKGNNEDEIDFTDNNLKNFLVENYDIDKDNKITEYDMLQIQELEIPYFDNGPVNLQGIEFAKSLKRIVIYNGIGFEHLTQLENLEELRIEGIYSYEDYQEIKNIPNLKALELNNVNLQNYSLADLPINLTKLTLNNSYINNLELINQFELLEELYIHGSYDSPDITGLETINQLNKLTKLSLCYLNLKNIDFLKNNEIIEMLDVSGNRIEDISVIETMSNLQELHVQYNNIQDITILRNTKFLDKEGYNNIAQNIKFEVEAISGEKIELELPKTIKAALDTNDEDFYINNLQINQNCYWDNEPGETIAKISDDNTKIIIDTSKIEMGTGTEYIELYGEGPLDSSSIEISYKIYANGDKNKIVEFEDDSFKNYLLQNHDIDNDGKITEFDMAQIKDLSIYNISLNSVKGIETAKNVTRLDIRINYKYDEGKVVPVDLSGIGELEKLEYLVLYGNTTDMNFVTKLQNLKVLDIEISNNKTDNIYLLENLTNLDTLRLTGKIETLEPIVKLENLISLTLTLDYEVELDLKPLEKISKLEDLTIWETTSKLTNFDTIGKLTNLNSLYITRYGNHENKQVLDYSVLKNLYNLYTLVIRDNTADINCEWINGENLYSLEIEANSLLNATEIEKFTELNMLSLDKSRLDNMDFVSNLNKLNSLSLTDNYITDLSPIENLKAFYVDLSNNPINPEEEKNARIIKLYEDRTLTLTEYEKIKGLEFENKEFEDELLQDYDLNKDGKISIYEMEKINNLYGGKIEHAEYLVNLNSFSLYDVPTNTEEQQKLIDEINKLNENVTIYSTYINMDIDLGNIESDSGTYTVNLLEMSPILKEFTKEDSKLYKGNLILGKSYNDENIAEIDGFNLTINKEILGEQNFHINYEVENQNDSVSLKVIWRNTTTGDKNKLITVKDEKLQAKLLQDYDIDKDGKFTEYDANNIINLDLSYTGINSLEGVENFKNLKNLSAYNNNISDLEPLRNMDTLEMISLGNNNISNIEPIMGLENLDWIAMDENNITDLSCIANRKFKLVTYLGLDRNYIDFSNDSEQLKIYLSELQKDMKNYPNSTLYKYNRAMICNFATSQRYGNPSNEDNEVKMDAKIKAKLIEAGADLNNDGILTEKELNDATISYYDENGNWIEATIKSLDLSNMGLTDISGLEYLSGLEELNLSNNQITNIEPLAHLMNLINLDLSYNKITDISVLPYYACNYEYRTINLSHNNITDISSVSNWTIWQNTAYCGWQAGGDPNFRMVNLDLSYNNIEDISGVKDYKCLAKLNLSNNKIKDISALKDYNFTVNEPGEESDITDELIEQLASFEGIDLSSNYIDVNAQGNKAAIQVFKDKNVYLNVDNQNRGMQFKDVSKDVWYYNSVKYCYDNGIIMGTTDTTFSPNNKLTRGNLVTILWRMEGEPKVGGEQKFPDVKTSDYYYEAVKWAEKNRIVSGYDNGKFGPNNYITREQLATILKNYADYKKKDTSARADLSTFTDEKGISSYAREGIAWAVANKVMSGKNNGTRVDPRGNATRAEAAAMIQNYCYYVGR